MVLFHLAIDATGTFLPFLVKLGNDFDVKFARNGHFARECPEFTGTRPAAPRVIDTGPRCCQNHVLVYSRLKMWLSI